MSIQHCFSNCRCFRFKTNRWSTNMCCSGTLSEKTKRDWSRLGRNLYWRRY